MKGARVWRHLFIDTATHNKWLLLLSTAIVRKFCGEEEEEEDQELGVEEEEEDQELSEKQHQQQQLAFHGFVLQQQSQEISPHHHHQLAFGLDFPPSPPQSPKKRSYLPSTSEQNKEEYARLRDKMGESHQQRQPPPPPPTASRFGLRNTGGGEIVEVQGGHIVRFTGRKDRHSKVCTAKGPRDRRVRLSAHTAIQFYDVQDRLCYDRSSKAVDWLIKKSKAAIDELAELPAWKPTNCSTTVVTTFEQHQEDPHQSQQQHMQIENENQQSQLQINNHENSSNFLPPSRGRGKG